MTATATKTKTKADDSAGFETGIPGVRTVRAFDPRDRRSVDVEVATVAGLGPIARRAGGRDIDGTPQFHYWHLEDDGKTLGQPIAQPSGNPRGDDVCRFEQTRKGASVSRILRHSRDLDAIDAAQKEFAAFRQGWPELSAALVVAGVVMESSNAAVPAEFGENGVLLLGRMRCAAVALADALARFARDDWGDFGKAGEHEVGPLERWSLGIQTRSIKNTVARADRQRIVVGRYPTPGRQPAVAGDLWIAARWIGGATTTPATSWAAWQAAGAALFEE